MALLGVGYWAGTRGVSGAPVGSEVRAMPMVLRQVQALGELHSARYHYENVFEQRTYLKPQGILANFPGAAELARATTQNEALVSAQGAVEAGVDLTLAKTDGKRLILPHAEIYEPQVELNLHSVRRRFFWRDDNIALKAVADAKSRMRDAAATQGIRDEAERNAKNQVARIAPEGTEIIFS